MIQKLLTFLFINLFVINLTNALPNTNGVRDIEFNIFNLGAALVDSSVMRFTKCIPGADKTNLDKLILDGAKLDCNSNTDSVNFCKCVNTIAGKNVDREKISKDLKGKYQDFLKNNKALQKKFMSKKYLEDYSQISEFVNDQDHCLPHLNKEEGSDLLIKEFQDEVSSGNVIASFDIDLMSKSSALIKILSSAKKYNNRSYAPQKKVYSFVKDLILNQNLEEHVFGSMDSRRFDKEILAEIETGRHPGINKSQVLAVSSALWKLNSGQRSSSYSSMDQIKAFLSGLPSTIIENQLWEGFKEGTKRACERIDLKFEELASDNFEMDVNLSNSFLDDIKSNEYGNFFSDGESEFSFRSFVETEIIERDPLILAEERFKADIYYCHEKKLTSKTDNLLAATVADEDSFKSLNEKLKVVRELSIDIQKAEDDIRTSIHNSDAMQASITFLKNSLATIEGQQKVLDKDLRGVDPSEGQASRHRYNKNVQKISLLKERLKALKSSRTNALSVTGSAKKRLSELLLKRQENRKEMTALLDGNEDAALELERRAVALDSKIPSVIHYDTKTNKYSYNKNFVKEVKDLSRNRFSSFQKVSGFDDAISKLSASGVKTFTDKIEEERPKVVPYQNKSKKYFTDFESAKSISKQIQRIPSEDLSKDEQRIKKQLKTLDNYERKLNENVNNYTKTNRVPKVPSENSKKISDLRKEIKSIKSQRDAMRDLSVSSTVAKTSTDTQVSSGKELKEVREPSVAEVAAPFIAVRDTNDKFAEERLPADNTTSKVSRLEPSIEAPRNDVSESSEAISASNSVSRAKKANEKEDISNLKDHLNKGHEDVAIFGDIVLTQEDFIELEKSLDPKIIDKLKLSDSNVFSVDTPQGRVQYTSIFQNGKLVRFEKLKTISKAEVLSAHKEEITKIAKIRNDLIKHSDLVNLFSGVINID